LQELESRVRSTAACQPEGDEAVGWQRNLGQLANNVAERIQSDMRSFTETTIQAAVESFTMVVIQQCNHMIRSACGGETSSQPQVIIAAYVALVILNRTKGKE
jgi:hypothetical protein